MNKTALRAKPLGIGVRGHDPEAWHIADGKLCLTVDKDVQKKWQQDVGGNIKKAELIRPSIRNKTPKSLA